MDYYLKTATEAELNELLVQSELAIQAEETVVLADGVSLDSIGTIYTQTEELDAEGNPVMVAIDGFHANLRVFKDLEEWQVTGLEQYHVEVSTPYRTWS